MCHTFILQIKSLWILSVISDHKRGESSLLFSRKCCVVDVLMKINEDKKYLNFFQLYKYRKAPLN